MISSSQLSYSFTHLFLYEIFRCSRCKMTYSPSYISSTDATLHAYSYFHDKYSNQLHSLMPASQAFTAKIFLAAATMLNHSHSRCIPLVKMMFHSVSFFLRNTALQNRLPCGCSPPEHSNVNHFNDYLPPISS